MSLVKFDQFTADVETGRLFENGREIPLRNKVRSLLMLFLEHPQEILSRDHLLDAVWDGEPTSDGSLSKSVAELRKALGGSAKDAKFIETVPKKGYRWLKDPEPITQAPVQQESTAAPKIYEPVEATAVVRPLPEPKDQGKAVRWAQALIAVLLIAALIVLFNRDRDQEKITNTAESDSIIILPFVNETGDQDMSWTRIGLPDYAISLLNESDRLNAVTIGILDRWYRDHNLGNTLISEAERQTLGEHYQSNRIVAGHLSKEGETYVLSVDLYDGDFRINHARLTGDSLIKLTSRFSALVFESYTGNILQDWNHASYKADPVAEQLYIQAREAGYRGLYEESLRLYEMSLERAPDFYFAKLGIARTLWYKGRLNDPRLNRFVEEGYQAAKAEGHHAGQSMALLIRAAALSKRGESEQAIRAWQEMIAFDQKERTGLTKAYLNLGSTYGTLGQIEKEKECYENFEKHIAFAEPNDVAMYYNNKGAIAREEGRIAASRDLLNKAVQLNKKLNALDELGNNYLELGHTEVADGNEPAATDNFLKAREIFQDINLPFWAAEAEMGLAGCAHRQKDDQSAVRHLDRAITIFESADGSLPAYEQELHKDAKTMRAVLENRMKTSVDPSNRTVSN